MAPLQSSARRARSDLVTAPISAFESETQAVIEDTAPAHERMILYVIAGMVFVLAVFMSVVKLDKVVTGTGRILPTQGAIFVQPLDRAIVTGLVAHAGDVVKKGAVLATLDPTFAQADLKDLEQKRVSGEALVARLKAEQAGQAYVADPTSPYSVLQASIAAQRNAEYAQSINDFDARMQAAGSAIQRSRQAAVDYQSRLALATQLEQGQVQLQQRGYGRQQSLLAATDARIEMTRMATESQSAAQQGQHELSALGAQRAAFIGRWRGDVATQLVTAENELAEVSQRLAKAEKLSDLSTLVSPADAVVLKVGKASIGSVTDPNEPLFTLTPLGGPLEAEIRIDARDIGFIKAGDTVRVKLDAYRYTSHGLAKGLIKTVSQGSFTTTDDGQIVQPYYKARVAITDARLRNVPANFRLTPGLTITGDVLVGRRTMIAYLLGGAMRTGSEAMREP